jgi:hypothetical protein
MATCTDLAAETVAGLLSSISNELITNTVYEMLGLGGGLFSFL